MSRFVEHFLANKPAKTPSSFQKGKAVKVPIPGSINKGSFTGTSETVIRFKSVAKHDVKSTTVLLIH
jgi:hypothetical protein